MIKKILPVAAVLALALLLPNLAFAQEAAKAGLACVFNVSEGFEGELDAAQQRGHADGWRFHGLPWLQD